MKFVHERPGQIDSAPMFSKQHGRRPRIRQAIQIESHALIPNCHLQLVRGSKSSHNNLLLTIETIAVNNGVGDDLTYGEPDLLQLNAKETRPLSELENGIFQRLHQVSWCHIGLFRERGGYTSPEECVRLLVPAWETP